MDISRKEWSDYLSNIETNIKKFSLGLLECERLKIWAKEKIDSLPEEPVEEPVEIPEKKALGVG